MHCDLPRKPSSSTMIVQSSGVSVRLKNLHLQRRTGQELCQLQPEHSLSVYSNNFHSPPHSFQRGCTVQCLRCCPGHPKTWILFSALPLISCATHIPCLLPLQQGATHFSINFTHLLYYHSSWDPVKGWNATALPTYRTKHICSLIQLCKLPCKPFKRPMFVLCILSEISCPHLQGPAFPTYLFNGQEPAIFSSSQLSDFLHFTPTECHSSPKCHPLYKYSLIPPYRYLLTSLSSPTAPNKIEAIAATLIQTQNKSEPSPSGNLPVYPIFFGLLF